MTDDDQIMISAFRYCLGRQTYIVEDCCRWLHERWEKLTPEARVLIETELGEAIRRDTVWKARPHPTGILSSGYLGSEHLDAPRWRALYEWMNHG